MVAAKYHSFGFDGPLRQYFSLYRAVSQRGRKKREKIRDLLMGHGSKLYLLTRHKRHVGQGNHGNPFKSFCVNATAVYCIR